MTFLRISVFVMFMFSSLVFADVSNPDGPKGPRGPPGDPGIPGQKGVKGQPGRVMYRGTSLECPQPCPPGPPGEKGDDGFVGEPGQFGLDGLKGVKGRKGLIGEPGKAGAPGPSGDDVLYLPFKPSKNYKQVCYSFRKSCLVPGLRNGWRAWYREGQSGYMIYNKWMYFVTLSRCPCKYHKPSLPQPAKPSDCVRLGECQE